MKKLKSFKCHFKSFGPSYGTFKGLGKLAQLECLYLYEEVDDFNGQSCLDDESVLEIMRGCGSLKVLYLHVGTSLLEMHESLLTDASIGFIDELCPNIEVLSIRKAAITDISLEAIARLKKAEVIKLIDLEKVTDKGIDMIMSSYQLID